MAAKPKIAIFKGRPFWDPFLRVNRYNEDLLGILRYFRDHRDWDVVGCGVPLSSRQTVLHEEDILASDIAGVIVEGNNVKIVSSCREHNIPVVATYWSLAELAVPTVRHDDAAIGRMAARYYLRRGFRNLAFCGPDYVSVRYQQNVGDHALWTRQRLDGFAEAAAKAGAHCSVFGGREEACASESDEARMERYWRDLRQWLRELPRPTGVFVCSDAWAMDCLQVCEEEGLHVPRDVAVLGVDNDLPRCEASRPSLSSVDRNMFRFGYEAAALLGRFLTGKGWGSLPVAVPPSRVVERLSTDVLAVQDLKMKEVLRFVHARFREPISPFDVARAVGLSERTLRRRFQEQLGFSLVSEIRRLRVEKACDLLSVTDLPIKEVAEVAGFASDTHLYHVFAGEVGVSPSTWRLSQHGHAARSSG